MVTLDRGALQDLFKSSSNDPALVLGEIRRSFYDFREQDVYRGRFPDRWIPSTFQVLSEPFTMDNGMMNSTMKIVRYKVAETYREDIDYMYTSEGGHYLNPRNTAAIKAMLG